MRLVSVAVNRVPQGFKCLGSTASFQAQITPTRTPSAGMMVTASFDNSSKLKRRGQNTSRTLGCRHCRVSVTHGQQMINSTTLLIPTRHPAGLMTKCNYNPHERRPAHGVNILRTTAFQQSCLACQLDSCRRVPLTRSQSETHVIYLGRYLDASLLPLLSRS